MVYGFVRQSGGHVAIETEPGRGTCVRIYLRRAGEAARAVPDPERGKAAPKGVEHILCVEDHDLVRSSVASQLSRLGYRVSTAATRAEALVQLRSGTPVDLLFADVVMPGEVKLGELVAAATSAHPEIRILLTSGYPDGPALAEALQQGCGFLPKPYRGHELAARVRDALDAPRARGTRR